MIFGGGGVIEHKMCFFLFPLQLLSETFLSFLELSDIWLKMYTGFQVLSDFNETWSFPADFRK